MSVSGKKTILLTGCSDGTLGSALALALHNAGWRVFASARNLSKTKSLEAVGIERIQLDVGSDESITAAARQVEQLTGGPLDGLINNVGQGHSVPIIHADIDEAHSIFELNVFSIVRVTRLFLPLLLKSTSSPIIANNTSGAALLGCGLPFQGIYSASKAAAAVVTESLRIELAPFGIRVINLVTGGVKSTFYQNANDAQLPEDSIYNVAKAAIEGPMNGDQPGMDKMDAETWAKQVAGDLSQRRPPFLIFRGTKSGMVRLFSHFPTGFGDSILKKMSGIDILEQKIKEQKEREGRKNV